MLATLETVPEKDADFRMHIGWGLNIPVDVTCVQNATGIDEQASARAREIDTEIERKIYIYIYR